MKISSVCDLCKQSPIAFECGNEEGKKFDAIAYYHVVPRQCNDPLTLMSNGELAFKVTITKEHPLLADEAHICCDCFDNIFDCRKKDEGAV